MPSDGRVHARNRLNLASQCFVNCHFRTGKIYIEDVVHDKGRVPAAVLTKNQKGITAMSKNVKLREIRETETEE